MSKIIYVNKLSIDNYMKLIKAGYLVNFASPEIQKRDIKQFSLTRKTLKEAVRLLHNKVIRQSNKGRVSK